MTRRGMMFRILMAVAIYATAIGIGCDLRFRYPNREDMHYVLFRDLVPLIVAIPAAWLAYCFQRRNSYLHQLRLAWPGAVAASRGALRYAETRLPTEESQSHVLEALGASIEELRGLFRPGRSNPAASLVAIRDEIRDLGSGEGVTRPRSESARSSIEGHWQSASGRLLGEFDRVVPAMA